MKDGQSASCAGVGQVATAAEFMEDSGKLSQFQKTVLHNAHPPASGSPILAVPSFETDYVLQGPQFMTTQRLQSKP